MQLIAPMVFEAEQVTLSPKEFIYQKNLNYWY